LWSKIVLCGERLKSLSLFLTSLLLSQIALYAKNDDDLNQALEEATYIATKTKLNADYVPGTVTVISGEKLKSLGINNLAEQNAYDMIVGFDSSTLSLRGAGSIYGSQGNKIKWMINDKPISSELWGIPKLGVGQIVFPIPTDAIDRIEIIRGPGSAIYGGNAIYGVVNIITKKESGALFTTLSRMESNKYGRGIGVYSSFENNGLEVSTLLSAEKHDGWDLSVNSQSRSQHGSLPNANNNNLFISDFTYKNFNFWAYRLESKNNYSRLQWDPTNYLPPDNDKPVQSNVYSMIGVEGKYNFSDITLTAKTGINTYTNRAEVAFFPLTNGIRTIDYAESTKYIEGTLETTIDSHRILGGAYAGFLSVDRDNVRQTWNSVRTLLSANSPKRNNKALYLQDEIEVNDKTTATIGARYDTYSDGRSALSPRVGLVYLYDESNIFKAQYSRAFRPPSFAEQYSPNNQSSTQTFESETADTFELSYLFKTKDTSLKTTAFHSQTEDMITFHDFTYETINLRHRATVSGLETEFVNNYETFNVGANLALYRSRRGEVHSNYGVGLNYGTCEFALSANVLANVFATLNRDTLYPTTLWYHYTGNKNRVSNALLDANGNVVGNNTTNGSVPAQDYLNITQTIKGLAKGTELQFGVKNVFGKTLRTLYFPLNQPDTHDVPYMKQSFWINLSYSF
jgi:outer membrane receptor for ferrienterochelin and colicins